VVCRSWLRLQGAAADCGCEEVAELVRLLRGVLILRIGFITTRVVYKYVRAERAGWCLGASAGPWGLATNAQPWPASPMSIEFAQRSLVNTGRDGCIAMAAKWIFGALHAAVALCRLRVRCGAFAVGWLWWHAANGEAARGCDDGCLYALRRRLGSGSVR
jgi:hypothetical protein